jgi:hypothetical protein
LAALRVERRKPMLDSWRIPYLAACMDLSACEAAWQATFMAWSPGRRR